MSEKNFTTFYQEVNDFVGRLNTLRTECQGYFRNLPRQQPPLQRQHGDNSALIQELEGRLDKRLEAFERGNRIYEQMSDIDDKLEALKKLFTIFYDQMKEELKDIIVENDKTIKQLVDLAKYQIKQFPDRKEEYQESIMAYEDMKFDNELKKQGGMSEMMKQTIEQMTGKAMRKIVFDSDSDKWAQNTSDFINSVKNRKRITVLVKSERNEWYGGYVNEKIDVIGNYITDDQAKLFIFGKEQKKYVIKQNEKDYACHCFDSSSEDLICFGSKGLFISREGHMSMIDVTNESSFREIEENQSMRRVMAQTSIATGRYVFTPRRILVIQMY